MDDNRIRPTTDDERGEMEEQLDVVRNFAHHLLQRLQHRYRGSFREDGTIGGVILDDDILNILATLTDNADELIDILNNNPVLRDGRVNRIGDCIEIYLQIIALTKNIHPGEYNNIYTAENQKAYVRNIELLEQRVRILREALDPGAPSTTIPIQNPNPNNVKDHTGFLKPNPLRDNRWKEMSNGEMVPLNNFNQSSTPTPKKSSPQRPHGGRTHPYIPNPDYNGPGTGPEWIIDPTFIPGQYNPEVPGVHPHIVPFQTHFRPSNYSNSRRNSNSTTLTPLNFNNRGDYDIARKLAKEDDQKYGLPNPGSPRDPEGNIRPVHFPPVANNSNYPPHSLYNSDFDNKNNSPYFEDDVRGGQTKYVNNVPTYTVVDPNLPSHRLEDQYSGQKLSTKLPNLTRTGNNLLNNKNIISTLQPPFTANYHGNHNSRSRALNNAQREDNTNEQVIKPQPKPRTTKNYREQYDPKNRNRGNQPDGSGFGSGMDV